MSNDALLTYIRDMLAVGHPVDVVKEGVKDKGGDPSLVDEVVAGRHNAVATMRLAIDEAKANIEEVHRYIDRHKSLTRGCVAAGIVGCICTLAWIGVAIATDRMVAYMACALGWGVGAAMRKYGNGFDIRFRLYSAMIAVASLFMANAVTVLYVFSKHVGIPFGDAMKLLGSSDFYLFVAYIHDLFMLVCYAAAILCAWWFGAHRLTDDKILEYALLVKKEQKA